MSSTVMSTDSIVAISDDFRRARELRVTDLHDITVPVTAPLTCELYFESVRVAHGSRLLLALNGEDVGELAYDAEAGRKELTVELTQRLVAGANDFRVRCIVSRLPLDASSDGALVWLKSDQSTIIRKAYRTRGSLEPFDQRWTLWFDPTK